MPATEVDLRHYRPFTLSKLPFLRGIPPLGSDSNSTNLQRLNAMVSVALALVLSAAEGSRRLLALSSTFQHNAAPARQTSVPGMNSGVAR
jgi:hypothetical protein